MPAGILTWPAGRLAIQPTGLENTESQASFRGEVAVSLGPPQSEAFVSHQGVDAQQAIVYLDLELQGTVVNVISRREVSTRGSKQEIAPVLGDKGIKLANRFLCVCMGLGWSMEYFLIIIISCCS